MVSGAAAVAGKDSSSQQNPVEVLLQRARETPDAPYLHQPFSGAWRTWSWKQVADESLRMAAALIALGVPKGGRVAITGINTAHWFMADFACGLAGLVGVGLYPKQSNDAVRYIAEHSEAKVAFIGPMPDIGDFLGALPADVVRIALPYPGVPQDPPAVTHRWDDLVRAHEPLKSAVARDADEMWSLIYTSGTTGNPKGVVITGRNLSFTAVGGMREMPSPGHEHFLSYLPLAHAFERGAVEAMSVYVGAEVWFLESLDKLAATLKEVRPTRFYGVPLVYTRIQSGVLKQMPQEKLDKLLRIPIVSGMVKRKLAKGLGLDRSWLRVSGAAPLPVPVMEWFKKLGLEIFQGYGMTENSIYVSVNKPGRNRIGSVGKPFADSEIRIGEANEIQNRHAGVTPGYFKDEEKTRELFTPDGWLRTGDVGRFDADGYLYITGRVKEIFKTLKGKYVSPAPIEGKFARNTDLEQLCMVGSGLFQPVMLVSLNADARKKDKAEVEKGLIATLNEVNETLEDHSAVAKIIVTKDAWTIDNGLMTPTMKVRRNEIEKRFGAVIQKSEGNRKAQLIWEG